MRAIIVLCGALVAAPGWTAPVQTKMPPAPTADELIARHIEARGGAERLKSIQSLRREGRLLVAFGDQIIELHLVDLQARPGRRRVEATLQGLTDVQAYDGKEAWQIDPFQGRKDPERLAPDEVKTLVLGADLDTPLVDYRAKGHSVQYLGLEDVEGSPAHKLRVALKSGDEITYFMDPDSMMVIRAIEKQLVRGTEKEVETDFGEYERVNGVWEPMSEESGAKGSSANEKERSLFEKAEANVPLNDAVFAFPVAAQATKESAK